MWPLANALTLVVRTGRKAKAREDLPQSWRKVAAYLHLDGGRLWYHPPPETLLDGEMTALLAIPEAAVKPILNAYHSDEMLAHPRTAIMNKLLRRRFFWPSMSSDVKRHVHRCSKVWQPGCGLPRLAKLSEDPSKNPCHNLLPLRTRERLG